MLDRLKSNEVVVLLSSWAILYIAIGMPLIHPGLHDRSAHDHGIESRYRDYFQAANGKEENHPCLICNFLMTSQILPSVWGASMGLNDGYPLIPVDRQFGIKTFSSRRIPRGPPPSNLIS